MIWFLFLVNLHFLSNFLHLIIECLAMLFSQCVHAFTAKIWRAKLLLSHFLLLRASFLFKDLVSAHCFSRIECVLLKPDSRWMSSFVFDLQRNKIYNAGIRLVIPIVFFWICFRQAAFLCPAGGWAAVPAALPAMVGGERKPAGPQRQRAGRRSSKGGNSGEDGMGKPQKTNN